MYKMTIPQIVALLNKRAERNERSSSSTHTTRANNDNVPDIAGLGKLME